MRIASLQKNMPWYRLVGETTIVKLPIGKANKQIMQGVWEGETSPTRYLVYALSFKKYVMGLTFTYKAEEEQKYMQTIEKLLGSLRCD